MGQRNAERAVRDAINLRKPDLVLTCGFAGALRPELQLGDVLFSANANPPLEEKLAAAGARPGRLHCAETVAVTSEEKGALWKATGADAVEMESGFIRALCHEQSIPSATVRVILDTAAEDLPLDFNRVMNANQQIDFRKLTAALMKSPGKIPALLRLQQRSRIASRKLSEVLSKAF
jgi:adenosylhomocysteine nucleosidase